MRLLILVLLIPLSAAAQTAERPLTLPEAYSLALDRSEQIAISGATYEETMAAADEVFARVLPQVNLMGTVTFQDVPRGQSGLFLQRQREQGWVNLQPEQQPHFLPKIRPEPLYYPMHLKQVHIPSFR